MNTQISRRKRALNGVLLLDKDSGMSSNSALQRARFLYGAAKAGHTGVLDPLATGLLPVCFGEATKFAQYLLDADKAYIATLQLGVATSTGDTEGEVVAIADTSITLAQIQATITAFSGEISQTPPMYSAIKHQGKPLYEYARAGITIERKSRQVTIYQIDVLEFTFPRLVISVRCSKGTYIRTLAEDMARHMGTVAHLTALRRIATAGFAIEDTYSLAAISSADEVTRDNWLLPCDVLVQHFTAVTLTDKDILQLQHGIAVHSEQNYGTMCPLRIYAANGRFIGLVQYQAASRRLKVLRLMNTASAG
ncbi:tRNA pseudouridine(55) synthase TruB [Snodgrassella communis]|uniref:tRNA pseudouridine synthase B n=1 Tax=Snodgrassella communis TaxID=2946699 RepID=A0A836Z3P5_9NEIS|nr:tRNA pseudouridine(55) synthase TruB [Snodgrassella communis]KDN15475.1 tRNA pseudouridine synthase B [Snodgrassella communis]PIT07162.1 tRNA pseudouridine(55) synthase TruB [Snodgrassella communis]PIT25960.1 tRNA pseudouridine(55) synthase TruB [Snodgrassella communis]PIT27702.1 tRNA pseudouridine(55) synthase TruB [Snodgrassella communis]PIT31307.1 tRNA pseudouridine(55) synthase TruB [Snodgrassella communis]